MSGPLFRCQSCDFETEVVYDAACHFYALGGDHHTVGLVPDKGDYDRKPAPGPYRGIRRMWVAPSFEGLGADVWCEGINRSRLGGERTLVWENVSYVVAEALVAAWNAAADQVEASR